MHWLLWLLLSEAEPNNISRLKHLSCLLYGHMPLQTPSLDFKTWTKAADQMSRISSWWLLQLQITHHIVWIQCEVLRCAGAELRLCWHSLAAKPTLAFIARPRGRKGLKCPGLVWWAWGLWTSHGSLSPIAKDIPVPCSSRRQCLSHACSAAFAGAQPLPGQAPAAWGAGLQAVAGTEAEGLGLRRRVIRQGHGTSSTELLIF